MKLIGGVRSVKCFGCSCSLTAVSFLLTMLARIVQRLEMSRVDREAREHEQSSGYDSEERTAAFVAHELRREGGVK